jgi:DNA modification methylase
MQNIPLKSLRNSPDNPRKIEADKLERLKKSLTDFPEMLSLRPLVVKAIEGGKYEVLGGNMRLKALKDLGYKEVPCTVADGLTAEQEREFMIKDNLGFGDWDFDTLRADWDTEELADWGLDLPELEQDKEAEAQEDDFNEEPPVVPITVLGDLYEIGQHRLLCGDSTDSDQVAKLMNGSKADMVFTSPPYNGNTVAGFEKDGGKSGLKSQSLYINNETDNKTAEDYIKFNADIFNTIKTIASNDLVVLYNINYNRNSPDNYIDVVNCGRSAFNLVETIIWEKSMAISLAGDNLTRIIEFIFVFYNGADKPKLNKAHTNECIKNLWTISNIGANHELHKACFPIKLVEQGIKVYAKESALLYEPFTGSGTTMVASHQLKRKCYGMELDPKYCDVIVRRMLKLDPSLTIKRNGIDCKAEFETV